jgi:hypothetical protein
LSESTSRYGSALLHFVFSRSVASAKPFRSNLSRPNNPDQQHPNTLVGAWEKSRPVFFGETSRFGGVGLCPRLPGSEPKKCSKLG